MRRKSGRSIARPLLSFNIDGANVDVLRGAILNAAAKRVDAESIRERVRVDASVLLIKALGGQFYPL
jgi:hypothetical protein